MKTKARTSPRRIPQQRRSRVTVDAIVEAAAHLLAARGWHASTTNHIAERAGVSIGSLYKYFPNKPSILAEVARRRIAGEVSGIAATMQAHAGDPRAMLRAMVAATVERYAVNAALDTALMEHLGPMEVARFLRDAEGAVVEMTEGYLARHRARLRARDSEEGGAMAFVVVHALRGVLVAAAARGPALLRTQSFREALAGMLERFLLPTGRDEQVVQRRKTSVSKADRPA